MVGAAKGALVGSGAGIPLAFATDFVAGSVGNALEQGITTGKVNLGESLIGGAENAVSQMLYGTGPIKGVKDAFFRGAKTGAVLSGIDNITDAVGPYGVAGSRLLGKKPKDSVSGATGRDPRNMCGSPDPFDLAETLGDRRRRHGGAGYGGGFSLGGFLKDVAIGGIVGGLGSAAFYGAGRAVNALGEHLDRGRGSRFPHNPNDLFPDNYAGLNKEVKANGKISYTVQAGDKVYRIEYHPKHKGDGHYDGNHYHVLKLGEFSKPGKASPPYFRIPNWDPDTPAKRGGGTFAPGDLFPTKNH